jgi:hypothetical protein
MVAEGAFPRRGRARSRHGAPAGDGKGPAEFLLGPGIKSRAICAADARRGGPGGVFLGPGGRSGPKREGIRLRGRMITKHGRLRLPARMGWGWVKDQGKGRGPERAARGSGTDGHGGPARAQNFSRGGAEEKAGSMQPGSSGRARPQVNVSKTGWECVRRAKGGARE